MDAIFPALLIGFIILLIVSRVFRAIVFNILLALMSSSPSAGRGGYSGGGSWGGGGSSGGGFSGGGGSSGGGGASGSW